MTLAEANGASGTIRRIWCTVSDRSPQILRSLRLDFYWDGLQEPSFQVPLADFFGIGLGRILRFNSLLFSSPEGRSFNCLVPMPFRTGMKIVLTNESVIDVSALYYDVDFTLGDPHGDDALYFHACYRRENPTTLRRDYEILPPVRGTGRFLGSTIGVIVDRRTYAKSWWGEGEIKMYIDDDRAHPTLCGTGTEDYIGTAWGLGEYSGLEQGCPLADHPSGQYWFYRHHLADPVYFSRALRVTMQQIGFLGFEPFASQNKKHFREKGTTIHLASGAERTLDLSASARDEGQGESYVIFEREDDWSSCAWFYLDKPQSFLPPIAPVEKRTEGLIEIDDVKRFEIDWAFCNYDSKDS